MFIITWCNNEQQLEICIVILIDMLIVILNHPYSNISFENLCHLFDPNSIWFSFFFNAFDVRRSIYRLFMFTIPFGEKYSRQMSMWCFWSITTKNNLMRLFSFFRSFLPQKIFILHVQRINILLTLHKMSLLFWLFYYERLFFFTFSTRTNYSDLLSMCRLNNFKEGNAQEILSEYGWGTATGGWGWWWVKLGIK